MCLSCARCTKHLLSSQIEEILKKVNTNSNIEYIEPEKCIIEDFVKKDIKVDIREIEGKEYLVIDNDNLNLFINNITHYVNSVNNYKQCVALNEEYLTKTIKTLL